MRLIENTHVQERMANLEAEIRAITQIVRELRGKQALSDLKRAEQRLIASQMHARGLMLPVKLFGPAQGQCKQQRQPYSVVNAHTRYPCSTAPKKPA